MITGNNKRLEFENLQDAMETAKNLMKNGYQVYMNIEDDLGDGKIIVVIEYEYVDDDLADGYYEYHYYDEEVEEPEQSKEDDDNDFDEDIPLTLCDDVDGDYSSWSEEHRKWFDAGYDEGYQTARHDCCDYIED